MADDESGRLGSFDGDDDDDDGDGDEENMDLREFRDFRTSSTRADDDGLTRFESVSVHVRGRRYVRIPVAGKV